MKKNNLFQACCTFLVQLQFPNLSRLGLGIILTLGMGTQAHADILNYKELKVTNDLPTETGAYQQFEAFTTYINGIKDPSQADLDYINSFLEQNNNYVLYPIALSYVINKLPTQYPLDIYLDYFAKYFNNTTITNRLVRNTWATYYKDKDYNRILVQADTLGNLNASYLACTALSAKLQLGQQVSSSEESRILNLAFTGSGLTSECDEAVRLIGNNATIDKQLKQKLISFISLNVNNPNNLNKYTQIFALDADVNNLYNYVKSAAQDPLYALQNNIQGQGYNQANDRAILRYVQSFKHTKDEDFDVFQTAVFNSNISNKLQNQLIAQYLDTNYYKLNTEVVDSLIATYHNDSLLNKRIRDAINQKQPYGQFLALLSKDEQNKTEWKYWIARDLENTDTKAAKKMYNQLSSELGFYGMVASIRAGNDYAKVVKSYIKPLDRAYNLERKLPWYAASIKEAATYNNTALTTDLWNSFEIDNKDTDLINWSYQNGIYFLGVSQSIKRSQATDLSARFPDAYADLYATFSEGRTVTKTFAQAIGRQESAWNPTIKSGANAYGLMQFINATAQTTARKMGLVYNGVMDLTSPSFAVNIGTYHLSELLDANGNNRVLTAIGYNAGPGRITQWLNKAGGKLDFDEFVATIPFAETRNYAMNTVAFDYYHQILQGSKKPVLFYPSEIDRKY